MGVCGNLNKAEGGENEWKIAINKRIRMVGVDGCILPSFMGRLENHKKVWICLKKHLTILNITVDLIKRLVVIRVGQDSAIDDLGKNKCGGVQYVHPDVRYPSHFFVDLCELLISNLGHNAGNLGLLSLTQLSPTLTFPKRVMMTNPSHMQHVICLFFSVNITSQCVMDHTEAQTATKKCSKAWCKQQIPLNARYKACDHCWECDRKTKRSQRATEKAKPHEPISNIGQKHKRGQSDTGPDDRAAGRPRTEVDSSTNDDLEDAGDEECMEVSCAKNNIYMLKTYE
jgi:hypothetical protein